jgi:hypothetical protein
MRPVLAVVFVVFLLLLTITLIYGSAFAQPSSSSSDLASQILSNLGSNQTTTGGQLMGDNNIGIGSSGGGGGGTGMNFNPMSFANNIFNASSLYGSLGISMVNGVKVTSINLLGNNEISVTLRHSAATDTTATANNNVNANATMSTALPPRVTVTAIRAPLNIKDLMSLASQSNKMIAANNNTSNAMSNPMMMGGGPLAGFGGAYNGTNNVNPLSFLSDLQIGSSSTIANTDWKLPQIVRMGLTGMMGNNNNKPTASTAEFIIVTVIPYTGKSTSPVG